MKTVLRNSYTPKIGDYCETIVVDKETENAYIFDCDGVFTPMPQPVDVEDILRRAAEYTDETVAPINEKLDTIEEGAQVNVIEHVLKNGSELTITNKTVNVTVPTKTSDLTNDGSDGTDTYVESATLSDYYTKTETDTQIGYETTAREIADAGLQEQIDAIVASSDVVDIVGTYADLEAYDTSKLHNNDIIKVLTDETRDDATTYYRWSTSTEAFSYIGSEGPFYTKAESDATFVPQTRTVNSKALSSDITLTASDVGALPDSTVIPTVNDATLTIQKNGTDVATFTANSATNATANISVPTDTSDLTNGAGFITSSALPTKTSELTNDGSDGTDTYAEMGDIPTKTSDLTNDGADGTSTYVETDELATVATTGDYGDLLNKPTIPTVNNATLTIQKNGTNIDTFTANASVDKTINVTVPTDTSDLTNGAGFITNSVSNLTNYYTKTDTYTQQETNALINAITIPTKTSDLTNDGSDGTSTYVEADALATVATTGDYGDLLNKPTIPTIVDMTGATASTAGAHGYVPAPAAGDEDKVLKGDGTWGTVAAPYSAGTGIDITNNVISADTTVLATQNDLSSKQDTLTAGDAIDITNNVISVEADSALDVSSTKPVQNSVVTAAINDKQDTLTAGSNITISGGTISATDTTYSDFTGATSSVAGAHGLVPAPTTSDPDKFLKGDGTWGTPPGTTYTAGTGIDITGSIVSVDTSVIAELSDLPTKTSELTNDGADGTSTYVEADDLATVATSGSYTDLSNKPTIPAAQVNSDWNATSGVAEILNKPTLATVATSGAYSDLSGTPTLAAVATSGSYNDLTNTPTIPTVNDGTLTIQKNGTSAGTFTANASSNKTINITVPTKVSELTSDAGGNMFVGTCSTAAATAAKAVTVSSDQNFALKEGAIVAVKFTDTNTASTPTIEVNSTGAKNIWYDTASYTGSAGNVGGVAGRYIYYIYDGTYWVWLGSSNEADTTYSVMPVSEGKTGTATTARTMRADYLKQIIDAHIRTADNLAPTADTPAGWNAALGANGHYYTWYSETGKFTNQPTRYGYLESFKNGDDVYQRWHSQAYGPMLYRSGNYAGWGSPSDGSWNTVATTADIGDATLTIQKNGTTVDTFTANATSNKTVDITVPTATSELTNDSGFITGYTAGDHISISNGTISASGYVHSENPVSIVDPTSTVSGSNITDGSITANKLATGATLQLTLSTTDIGEGAPLAANTLYGVYE